jgi:hypothetical protein
LSSTAPNDPQSQQNPAVRRFPARQVDRSILLIAAERIASTVAPPNENWIAYDLVTDQSYPARFERLGTARLYRGFWGGWLSWKATYGLNEWECHGGKLTAAIGK